MDGRGQVDGRDRALALRWAVAVPGVLLAAYGAYRILSQGASTHPAALGVWLVVAVVVHDGVLSPLLLVAGALLTRRIPARARRYVQGGLVSGALVTVVALPLIYRQGRAPAVKALLRQDYGAHLALLIAVVAAGTAAAYGVRVLRDRRSHRP